MQLEVLFELKSYVSVSFHKAGQLGLKVKMSVAAHPAVRDYIKENGFAPPKGIRLRGLGKTSFNPLTRKLVVSYDKEVINPRSLARLLYAENIADYDSALSELSQAMDCDLKNILPTVVKTSKAA